MIGKILTDRWGWTKIEWSESLRKKYQKDYFNEFGEISLTNKEEYKMFPKTPRPTIVLDGFFITKKDKETVRKINENNEIWNRA